jgi:DNA-directed RNA polymerase specialized sigma24 family protein
MDRHQSPLAELLQQAFDRLPLSLREPLLLARAEGLTYEQVGARLGLSPAEVERRIGFALARLDRDLERMKWHEWRRW